MKLSATALTLLTLIGDHTSWQGDERPGQRQDQVLSAYWVPSAYPQWSQTLRRHVTVHGGGDAVALRALERKRLIRRERAAEYAYSITEDGLVELARNGEER